MADQEELILWWDIQTGMPADFYITVELEHASLKDFLPIAMQIRYDFNQDTKVFAEINGQFVVENNEELLVFSLTKGQVNALPVRHLAADCVIAGVYVKIYVNVKSRSTEVFDVEYS